MKTRFSARSVFSVSCVPASCVLALTLSLCAEPTNSTPADTGTSSQTNPIDTTTASTEAAAENAAAAVEQQEAWRPKIVAFSPPNGSDDVPPDCELRLRFDRPMDPMSFKLKWSSGGFLHCGEVAYDSNRFEFSLPVRLTPGTVQRLVLNQPLLGVSSISRSREQFPLEGFHSTEEEQAAFTIWQFKTRRTPSAPSGPAPKVLSISPPSGRDVNLLTFLEIQFDQPMMPIPEAFPWLGSQTNLMKSVGLLPDIRYIPSNHTFRLALLFPPRNETYFKVASKTLKVPRMFTPPGRMYFTLEGFRSTAGISAAPIPIEYRILETEMSETERERLRKAGSDPRLTNLLAAVKRKRAEVRSIAERVQTVEYKQEKGVFRELESNSAFFRMQEPGCYYGDISEMMLSCRILRIGSDGRDWWEHCEHGRTRILTVCPAGQMHIRDLSFCDPFGLVSNSVPAAITAGRFTYAGLTNFAGREYHLVESCNAEAFGGMNTFGRVTRWWIDARTLMLTEVVTHMDQMVMRQCFHYESVGQPLEQASFTVPKVEGISVSPPDTLDTNYNQRLVIIHDGADGRMTQRWGKRGPGGMSSGGLN